MDSWRGVGRRKGALLALALLVLAAASGGGPDGAHPPMSGTGGTASLSRSAATRPTLSLVASDSNPFYTNAQGTGLVDRLAREAFARLGQPVRLGVLPSERAIKNVQDALDDGDLLRIGGLSGKYPNLVQVPEPWLVMKFSAFSSRSDLEVKDWNDLRPLTVGIIKGWKVAERNTQGFSGLIPVGNAEQLFQLLKKNRADVIVYDSLQGQYFINKLGLGEVRRIDPPLSSNEIYLYLNQQHTALAEPVAAAIRSMKKDGTHARLLREGMAELMR